jgi:hypothetical protein
LLDFLDQCGHITPVTTLRPDERVDETHDKKA